MKVYLDDIRTPQMMGWDDWRDWIVVGSVEIAIELLKAGLVTDIHLDNDLGGPGLCSDYTREGYEVVTWIEEQVATTDFTPPNMFVHTANSSRARMMHAGITKIKELVDAREEG